MLRWIVAGFSLLPNLELGTYLCCWNFKGNMSDSVCEHPVWSYCIPSALVIYYRRKYQRIGKSLGVEWPTAVSGWAGVLKSPCICKMQALLSTSLALQASSPARHTRCESARAQPCMAQVPSRSQHQRLGELGWLGGDSGFLASHTTENHFKHTQKRNHTLFFPLDIY